MDIDDPSVPEFARWDSYGVFADRVRSERRYATDLATRGFISTVLATAPIRATPLNQGAIAFRAQIGVDQKEELDERGTAVGHRTWGFSAMRMAPDPEKAADGRANPIGVAFLYLALSEKTAISEVRPWIASEVSVAQFQITRDLKLGSGLN